MNPHRLRAYIYLVVITVIWAVSAPIIKYTLSYFDPSTFLFYRFIISSFVALIYFLSFRFSFPKNPKIVLLLVTHGILVTTVTLGILFLGIKKTTAIDATLIGATAPIFTAIAGVVYFHEHITRGEKIGITIAFLGTLITLAEPILKFHDGKTQFQGNLLVLLATVIGVITAVTAKKLLREGVDATGTVHLSFVLGLVTIAPFALLSHPPSQIIYNIFSAGISYHLGVFYMAILSGTVAYILWTKAVKTIEIGEAGVFGYLSPVFAIPVSILWLGEQISLPFILGAIIIAAGVVLAEYKKPKKAEK